jgi:DNA-binding response OmpR family regulator
MGSRVLVVDDDPTVSDVVRRHLKDEGHHVRLAADGSGGPAAVKAQRPDLIVLGVKIPGVSGIDVCRRLRRHVPGFPIVMRTSLGDEADRIVGLEVGAGDYVVWVWRIGDSPTVPVHVRRLREKIDADPAEPRRIVAVWGVGYRFEPVEAGRKR